MRYGDTGTKGLFRLAATQGAVVLVALAPLVLVMVVAGPRLIATWLPQYQAAIPALIVLVLAYVGLLSGMGFWNLLIVLGHAKRYVAAQLGAIGVEAALCSVLLSVGMGLVGAALAALVAFCMLTVSAVILAFRATA